MSVKVADSFAGRRRTAWMIVLLAFAIFVSIAITIPLLISSRIRQSVRPMTSVATSNQGSLALVETNGDSSAILETDNGLLVNWGDNLITQGSDNGTLIITHPDTEALIFRGQIYANSTLVLDEATTPRYSVNQEPDLVNLQLKHGRLRVTLPAEKEPINYFIQVAQGTLELNGPGQFTIVASEVETQLSVFEGVATLISADGTKLDLSHSQRAILTDGAPPDGPYATSRNLIRNGSFNDNFSGWLIGDWQIELEDQKSGETKNEMFSGDNSVRFIRNGVGHADTTIRQDMDEDVTDFQLLELVVTMRIHGQTLWVCGEKGSECPLMVRLEYEDELGILRRWEQGFFADGQVSAESPDTCQTCELPSSRHQFVQPGRIISQEIDLVEELQGFKPSRVLSVSITSAGHAFDAEVFDIALNARE